MYLKSLLRNIRLFYSVELLLYSALYYRDQIDFVESESSLIEKSELGAPWRLAMSKFKNAHVIKTPK